jgi:hypothetical protein
MVRERTPNTDNKMIKMIYMDYNTLQSKFTLVGHHHGIPTVSSGRRARGLVRVVVLLLAAPPTTRRVLGLLLAAPDAQSVVLSTTQALLTHGTLSHLRTRWTQEDLVVSVV